MQMNANDSTKKLTWCLGSLRSFLRKDRKRTLPSPLRIAWRALCWGLRLGLPWCCGRCVHWCCGYVRSDRISVPNPGFLIKPRLNPPFLLGSCSHLQFLPAIYSDVFYPYTNIATIMTAS